MKSLPLFAKKPSRKRVDIPPIKAHGQRAKPGEWSLLVPIRVVSEANMREHWATKRRRKIQQQEEFALEWRRFFGTDAPKASQLHPLVITFTRIGPKALDSDNLAGAFKGLRDQLAKILGIDDGSDALVFKYDQRCNGKRQYAIKVELSECPF